MRSVKHVLGFLLLLFFVWQSILIGSRLRANCLGKIDPKLSVDELNERRSFIPRRIHQMWRTTNLSDYPIGNSHQRWKAFSPTYEIFLWTDKRIEELFNRSEYRYLQETYHRYPYAIQRADLSRLLILYDQGGIYADLDVFPRQLSRIESLRLRNVSFLIPRSSEGSTLINHFLLSERSSPILGYLLHQVRPASPWKRIYLLPYLEVFSTGSIFLTEMLRRWLERDSSGETTNLSLGILSEKEIGHYIEHHTGRSWHSLDGYLLNQLVDRPGRTVFFVSLLLSLLLLFYFFLKKQRRERHFST